MLFKTPRFLGAIVNSETPKQLELFTFDDNGNSGLRQWVDRSEEIRRIPRPKEKPTRDRDLALVKAVVVQIGFLRPNVKITVEVNANSILLQRISEQWPDSIVTSGKGFAMVETVKPEIRLPLVFGIPTTRGPAHSHSDDGDRTFEGLAETLGEVLGKIIGE